MIGSSTLLLVCSLLFGPSVTEPGEAPPEVDDKESYPVLMEARKATYVRSAAFRGSAVAARVYRGAVLRLAPTGSSRGCGSGWMARQGGGYVCRKHLKKTDATESVSVPLDNPNLIDGFDAYEVVKHGPRLYRKRKAIKRKSPFKRLRLGSILIIKNKTIIEGDRFLVTRKGWFVEAEHLRRLPERIDTLAVEVADPPPLGVAIRETSIRSEPSVRGVEVGTFPKWSTIEQKGEDEPEIKGGWLSLGPDRYIRDKDVARVRPAPIPKGLAPDERWIAVDIDEQMLHAYEGERLIRVMPCSTGKRGNTTRGRYRIQWKRRAQTMQLRMGEVRVEDVQWVMYYNRKGSIAIHTAYWHHKFGTPVSHGCVNLPILDARWLFEWSAPTAIPTDSERFPTPSDPGSRVVVF